MKRGKRLWGVSKHESYVITNLTYADRLNISGAIKTIINAVLEQYVPGARLQVLSTFVAVSQSMLFDYNEEKEKEEE